MRGVSDIDKMQADAVSRAKEMYSRRSPSYEADGFPKGYNGTMKPNGYAHPEDHKQKANDESKKTPENSVSSDDSGQKNNPVNQQVSNVSENGHSGDILTSVLADKERALIILLIALLNEENASPSLMMALMYLII